MIRKGKICGFKSAGNKITGIDVVSEYNIDRVVIKEINGKKKE
ncbi:MAG: hypothetical protein R3B66_11565 [Candidatus Scalinduaceae bacterium]